MAKTLGNKSATRATHMWGIEQFLALITTVLTQLFNRYNYHTCKSHDHDHQLADLVMTYSWWEYQLTQTVQNGGPRAISEILHIEYRILCCIETYLIYIYNMNKCTKCNWNRYIEGFCTWNVHFHINGLSPNITNVISMSWTLMAIYFLLLNYWLFSVQFSYHI